MTPVALSREARILIIVLVLTAVVWLTINLLGQNQSVVELPTVPMVAPAKEDEATPIALIPLREAAGDDVTTDNREMDDVMIDNTVGDDVVAAPNMAEGATPSRVATDVTLVARDIQIAQLPFLVTAAPGLASATDEGQEGGETRPRSEQRVSVNPFSPIIVKAVEVPLMADALTPADAQSLDDLEIADVPIRLPDDGFVNDGFMSSSMLTVPVTPAVAPPAPRIAAPPAPAVANLPRALPGGVLPVSLTPLQSMRNATAPALPAELPENLAEVAAILVPQPEVSVTTNTLPLDGGAAAEQTTPLLLRAVGQVREQNVPLVVGSDSLSRYLRDRGVRFSGAVLGPVSVGIFRMGERTTEVVLGQTLADSDIVLTELSSTHAVFTQANKKHVLILDTRR